MLDSEVESLPENAARPVKATADHSVRTTKSQGNGQDNFREEHRDTSAIEISLHRLNQKELTKNTKNGEEFVLFYRTSEPANSR